MLALHLHCLLVPERSSLHLRCRLCHSGNSGSSHEGILERDDRLVLLGRQEQQEFLGDPACIALGIPHVLAREINNVDQDNKIQGQPRG